MKIEVDGIRLAYEEAGAGTPLLLVHGFPHSRELWRPQLEGLSRDGRCIAPDLRGFGESDVGGPYSMDRYANDLAALLDSLELPQCVVCGLSMGGYVAFAMWRHHRDRIAAMVLADTRAEADDEQGREKRRKMMALARDRGSAAVADEMITGMVGKSTRERRPETVERVHAMLAAAPVEGVVGALEAMMNRADATDLLGSIDVPTLLIVGDEDVLTPPKFAVTMHEAIPGSTLLTIPGAGHVSNIEQPGPFNVSVRDLLRGIAL